MEFRKLVPIAVAVAAAAASATSAMAQSFPTRPVRLVVPYTPGAGADIVARTMGNKLTEIWGQTVLVDNRAGGSTMIGTDIVAKATPDGHTIAWQTAAFAINPVLFAGKLPYDSVKDFAHIMLVNTAPNVLVVPPGLPVKDVKELIARAKAMNGTINWGSSGVGGASHLSGELFLMMADIKGQHIPYKGLAPALTDAMAGRVDFVFGGSGSMVAPVQSGKLRPLGVASLKRISLMPDVPTLDEQGLKGYASVTWNGLSVPARTPAAIVNKINADANKALASAEMQQRMKTDSAESGGGTVKQFEDFIRDELNRWGKVIKAANIKPE